MSANVVIICSAYLGIFVFAVGFFLGKRYAESVADEKCRRCMCHI